jgi:hypothetical protein
VTRVSRADRARRGSRRQRDLDALAAEQAPPDDITADPNAAGAWAKILATLRPTLPESAYLRWLEPVEAIGSRDGVLCLATPRRLGWYEERYGNTLDELSRLNGYDGWAIYAGKGGPIS